MRPGAFLNAKTQLTSDQRFDSCDVQIVKSGASLASDLNRIFKSSGRHQRSACAFPLQQSVGPYRRTMEQDDLTFATAGDFLYCVSDGFGWIMRGGKDFE